MHLDKLAIVLKYLLKDVFRCRNDKVRLSFVTCRAAFKSSDPEYIRLHPIQMIAEAG